MTLGPEANIDGMSNERILEEFGKLANLGVIEYVLPSEPIGERWVIGLEGKIASMDAKEAFGFLLGSTATANWAVRRLGVSQE